MFLVLELELHSVYPSLLTLLRSTLLMNEENTVLSDKKSRLLQSSSRWTDHAKKEHATVSVSLASRLSSLTTSADRWKSRVEKESDLDKCRPRSRAIKKRSIQNTPLLIDQGVESFFTPPCVSETSDLPNLDSIAPTEKLPIIRKTPVARPQKRLVSRIGDFKREKRIEDSNDSIMKCFEKPLLDGVKDDILELPLSEDMNEPVSKSARDGLASTQDYNVTKKALRSTSNNSSYPELLLIQVGGDEYIDVRAIVASSESIHDAASYLLITRSSLIIHNGSESKVLERSKAMQIASSILHTKQLDCGASKVERTCDNEITNKQFWRSLKSNTEIGTIATGYDLMKKNRVFSVDPELEIKMEIVGEVPCYSLLEPCKCFIFDFWTELWWWCGRQSSRRQIRATQEYTKQLQSQISSSFLVVGKVPHGSPNVLFSSKIMHWPMDTLLTSRPQMNTPIQKNNRYKWKQSIQSDALSITNHLIKSEEKRDEIVMEDVAFDGTNGNVITENKKMWILEGENLKMIENTNTMMRDSCYVLRWQYRVEIRVGRLVDGESDEERETGRERIAFFYWLGRKSGVKERGICALQLSEMDKTKSPHIRMEEGSEAAIFLSLFNGGFTVVDNDVAGDTILLALSKSHGRSSFSQMDVSSPFRSHGTYIRRRKGEWMVVAGIHSDINDVRAALEMWDGSSKEVEYIVQGDDTSMEWIDCNDESMKLRMYRILGSQSDILQPSRPGTTFPYSQSSLDSCILVDCGKKGWLWSEIPLSDTTINVAIMMKEELHWTKVDLIEKGEEPKSFKALFPVWEDYEEGKEEKVKNLEDVIEERMGLSPLEAIERHIDIETIEKNLSDESFQDIYGISRTKFSDLPKWRKIEWRKEKGFF